MFRRRGGSNAADGFAGDGSSSSSPLREISSLMDQLEASVESSMNTFVDSLVGNPNEAQQQQNQRRWLRRFRRGRDDNNNAAEASPRETSPKSNASSSPYKFNKQADARFVPMTHAETASFVETLRRISELVVIGERAAAKVQEDDTKLRELMRKESLLKKEHKTDESGATASEDGSRSNGSLEDEELALQLQQLEEESSSLRDSIAEKKEYASVYDQFFERNGLAMIANILTGKAFDLPSFVQTRTRSVQEELQAHNNKKSEPYTTPEREQQDADTKKTLESVLQSLGSIEEKTEQAIVLLPPLAVAIQGFQSTSILVQNVKRATSLFFILSNNHINQLIGIPLEEYHIAERSKLNNSVESPSSNNNNLISPRRFASPELGELTTTFVSFLKSLAMRMNAETLQFFLTYPSGTTIEGDTDYLEEIPTDPSEDDEDRPLDEIGSNAQAPKKIPVNRPVTVKTIRVEFPLYERALEFCSAHQDSFVRTTAMNICLNTLRLTTVEAKPHESEPGEVADKVDMEASLGASPDGVLHNAKALPMRERLAIAQYVCAPSRVEKIASPVFTKLAQLWGLLEEQFRDMEVSSRDVGEEGRIAPNEKVARARETARRKKYTGIFNDTSYNLQDELLLLEDMLKVGLTSLNEQVVEMMFATFVYPLLLQPLLLYFQRSPVGADLLFADALRTHLQGSPIHPSDAKATEKAVISAPAKSALFCLSAAFSFLNNPPLLKLLFAAIFHPLSPDAKGHETMIRAKADVACMGADGKPTIRIDRVDTSGTFLCEHGRETYSFGTVTGRKETSLAPSSAQDDTCVFVLAPALSEILQFSGTDGGLVARSKHNPYRKAIFQCLTLNREVSDLQDLAVMAVYTAVSKFEQDFLVDLLFGLDLKTYRDNLPKNERFDSFRGSDNNVVDFEDDLDDRGIGSSLSAQRDSRLSLSALEGGTIGFDYRNQVISSFRSCILNAAPGGKGTWKLQYDTVAANALLLCVKGNEEATRMACTSIRERYGQAAAFLADLPETLVAVLDAGKLWGELKGLLPKNCSREVDHGAIMDMVVRRSKDEQNSTVSSILDHMMCLSSDSKKENAPIYVPTSSVGSYNDVGARASSFAFQQQGDATSAAFDNAVESTSAVLRLNAFVSLLSGLSTELFKDRKKLGGFIFQTPSQLLSNPSDYNTIYSPISDSLDNALLGLDPDETSSLEELKPGSVTTLSDKMAFPCVCEVPPSMAPLFSAEGAKVVSQGITWQSLYLIVIGDILLMVEPLRGRSAKGRVVTLCRLENLKLDKDPDDARVDTSARRLIMIYETPDLKPPGMFRFEKEIQPQTKGPFSRVQRHKSSLDIWFEDSNALGVAFSKVFERIVLAKANRGNRIRQYLSQGAV